MRNNNYNTENGEGYNFYDDFSSMGVEEEEEDEDEDEDEVVPVPVPVPTRYRKRRRATTPPRKRKRNNKSSDSNICSRIMNFMGDAMASLFFKNK
jgi:hypothetical protein